MRSKILFYVLSGFLSLFLFLLLFLTERENFPEVLLWSALSFTVFLGISGLVLKKFKVFASRWHLISVAILLRILLLFSFPKLSDDVYRFLWDGRLLSQAENPYLELPSKVNAENDEYAEFLLSEMNSPDYYTVYPPLNQFIFSIPLLIAPFNLLLQVHILKIVLLLLELPLLFLLPLLLRKLGIDWRYSVLYLLNPLVLMEGLGNLHFEVATMSFLLLFFYFLTTSRFPLAAVSFGLSVAIKLIPLILSPLILAYLGWKKGLKVLLPAFVLNLLLFLPFMSSALFSNFFSSIDLYFHRFEFNASLYYLLREVGYSLLGYNAIASIGTLLSILTIFFVCYLAYRLRKGDESGFYLYAFLSLLIYYLLSTTVHPWYLINLLFLALLAGFYRSMTVWSMTVILSYSAYVDSSYSENMYLILVEYLVFFIALYIDIKKYASGKYVVSES